MTNPRPTVGRQVHYVSYGSPVRPDGTQKFTPECRAATVTAAPAERAEGDGCVSLAVLNPSGLFFDPHICHDEETKAGGTWHWPERDES